MVPKRFWSMKNQTYMQFKSNLSVNVCVWPREWLRVERSRVYSRMSNQIDRLGDLLTNQSTDWGIFFTSIIITINLCHLQYWPLLLWNWSWTIQEVGNKYLWSCPGQLKRIIKEMAKVMNLMFVFCEPFPMNNSFLILILMHTGTAEEKKRHRKDALISRWMTHIQFSR